MVLGASFDSVAENRAFAVQQRFGFRLLSDEKKAVGQAYRVVRTPDDQYAAFPQRVSYLIDPGGIIVRAYGVADVRGHADAVLAELAALRGAR